MKPEEKAQALEEYIIKQLIKGNTLLQITAALKKLGWEAELVDKAAQEISTNKEKHTFVEIARFAYDYDITSMETLEERYPLVDHARIYEALMLSIKIREASTTNN